MNRFSLRERGCVCFPVHNPRFTTGDGGSYVRLVVIDPNEAKDDSWMLCCGGHSRVMMDGAYVRDDVRPDRDYNVQEEHDKYVLHHFPDHGGDDELEKRTQNKYESIDYLAVVTLGSAGVAFYDTQKDDSWFCTYSDLTEAGKRLYDGLKILYDGCEIIIQTWVDT